MGTADKIAARGTVGAGVTHAANADLVAIVRAGRKLNCLLGGHTGSTAAAASEPTDEGDVSDSPDSSGASDEPAAPSAEIQPTVD